MRQRNRFRNYLSLEALVVLAVLALTKTDLDSQVKALIVNSIFSINAVGILIFEMRFVGFRQRASFWGSLIFLCFGNIPALALRLINPQVPFDLLSFGGIHGQEIDSASRILFGLMVLCFFIDSYLSQRRDLSPQKQ